MRWRFVAQVARFRRQGGAYLLAQGAQFLLQLVDLLLLPIHGAVQRFQKIF